MIVEYENVFVVVVEKEIVIVKEVVIFSVYLFVL